MVKNPPANDPSDGGSIPGWEDPLEEGMVPSPVFLPGEPPWTEKPGGLPGDLGSPRSQT